LQKLTSELEQQKDKASTEEESILLSFDKPEYGISFQYPESLGSASLDILPNDEDNAADDVLRMTFSANPDIWINLSGPEYEGDEPFTYSGSENDEIESCEVPLEISEDGYCDTKSIANQQVIERVLKVGEDELLNVVKTIAFDINASQYAGMTVNLGLGLPPVTGRSLFAPTDEDIQQEALLDFYRNILKEEGLSLIVKENIQVYEQILSTLTTP